MCSREDLKKKLIEEEVRKKVESEKKAHEIVTSLLETDIKENYFLESVAMVTESHYQDVTEERSILNICGFALCDKKLQNVPKQKFKIYKNKVFDLENRKHFCSELCYKRSNDVKDQIPGLPMWLRDENTTDRIRLTYDSNTTGLKGEEINIVPKLALDNVETLGFNNTMPDPFEDLPAISTGVDKKKNVKFEKVIEIKPERKKLNANVVDSVLEVLKSWVTTDTVKVLKLVPDKSDLDVVKQEKLKRLHDNLNKVVMGTDFAEDNQQEKKAKNENLKKEDEDNEVYMERVERFFKGSFDLKHKAKLKVQKEVEDSEISKPVLPEIDSKNQVNIRRRILTEKLIKVVQDLIPTLPNSIIFEPLKTLVKTFNISSKNVKLQTHEYPLVGIIILLLLNETFSEFKEYVSQSKTNFEIILKSYSTNLLKLKCQIDEIVKIKINS